MFTREKGGNINGKKSFHGRTYGSLTATGQPENACQNGFKPILLGFSYADFNDLESFKVLVTDNTIVILVELIEGKGKDCDKAYEILKLSAEKVYGRKLGRVGS